MLNSWGQGINNSFHNIGQGVVNFLPDLILAIVIVIVGWVVGALIGKLISQLFRTLKIDQLLRTAGVDEVVRRAGYNLDSGRFVGALVEWFVIMVVLVAAFDVLHLQTVNSFLLSTVENFLPQVIISVIILMAAAVVSDVMAKIVVGSSRAAGIKTAHVLGLLTRWAIIISSVVAVMIQLNIFSVFAQIILNGVVIAVSIAFGLAFGLGGQSAASELIAKVRHDISEKH